MTPELIEEIESARRWVEGKTYARNLHEFLTNATKASPDQPLWNFFDEGVILTYREALTRSEAIAQGLLRLGVRRGTHVGVMLPNIPEYPLTWFALAFLGAVIVPINAKYTASELEYVLRDSDAEYLVVEQDSIAKFLDPDCREHNVPNEHVIVVGEPSNCWTPFGTLENLDGHIESYPEAHIDDLVNIQYTSGTTGFPKGVIITQRYWLVLAAISSSRCLEEGIKNLYIATPFTYVDPTWMTVMAVELGGTLFVGRTPTTKNFMQQVRDHNIHYCIFNKLAMKLDPSPLDKEHQLKRVATFGVPGLLRTQIEERFGVIAREAYGMTELGGGLYMPVKAYEMVGTDSCGIPSPLREAMIVDNEGNELPAGASGELCIRGPGVTNGYYKKEEVNASTFLRGGWFKTGDLFRKDEQGFYYIVGRVKDMVRRSSENIAAREVESVIEQLESVKEVAIVGVPDADRGEEVKAYIVLNDGFSQSNCPPQLVFDHCGARLAKFKVPRYIEYVESFPRTSSDKIAKHVLVKAKSDLRAESFDRVDNLWR